MTDLVTEDGELVRVAQQRDPAKTYQRGPFVIVFTEAMAKAAKEIKQGMTLRVLHLLPEHLNFTDFRSLPTVTIGQQLGTGSGAISRALSQLLELNIVEKEGKGPRTKWRLSTNWGWNGTVDQYHAFNNGRMKGKKPPVRAANSQKSHNAYKGNSDTINGSSGNINSKEAKQSTLRLLRKMPERNA